MGKSFVRRTEDFICERCGNTVKGTGYTNHCPFCLWSKHVDVFPGDRASICKGMMEPVSIEKRKNHYVVIHRCTKCGYEKRNKTAQDDNFDILLQISMAQAKGVKQ